MLTSRGREVGRCSDVSGGCGIRIEHGALACARENVRERARGDRGDGDWGVGLWRREGMRRTGARDRAREVSPGARVREGVGRLEVDGPVDVIRGRPRGEGKGLAGLLSPY